MIKPISKSLRVCPIEHARYSPSPQGSHWVGLCCSNKNCRASNSTVRCSPHPYCKCFRNFHLTIPFAELSIGSSLCFPGTALSNALRLLCTRPALNAGNSNPPFAGQSRKKAISWKCVRFSISSQKAFPNSFWRLEIIRPCHRNRVHPISNEKNCEAPLSEPNWILERLFDSLLLSVFFLKLGVSFSINWFSLNCDARGSSPASRDSLLLHSTWCPALYKKKTITLWSPLRFPAEPVWLAMFDLSCLALWPFRFGLVCFLKRPGPLPTIKPNFALKWGELFPEKNDWVLAKVFFWFWLLVCKEFAEDRSSRYSKLVNGLLLVSAFW